MPCCSCPILYVRGRQHPVTILNTLATPDDYQEAAVRAVFQIHVSQPEGDILVFLTGSDLPPRDVSRAGADGLIAITLQVRRTSTTSPSSLRRFPTSSRPRSGRFVPLSHVPPSTLNANHSLTQLSVLPFMASTSPVDQAKVFAPAALKTRKVILATNVAETSITLPGIKYVVDSGYAKQKNYVSRRGTGESSHFGATTSALGLN